MTFLVFRFNVQTVPASSADASASASSASPSSADAGAKNDAAAAPAQKYGLLLDKPWYYRVGLAMACGIVLGIISSVMIMSFRQAPKNSSAYQSLLSLLKENPIARDLLGENVGTREGLDRRSRARAIWWERARRTGRTSR